MTKFSGKLQITFALSVALGSAVPSAAQVTGATRRDSAAQQRPARDPTRGVLGGVPMTAADSAIKAVISRLDFESY